MRVVVLLATLIMVTALLPVPTRSAASADEPQLAAKARSRETIRRMMADSNTPGVAVAVVIEGEVVWTEGFGFASIEHLVPATTETRFGVGSISKSITMATVARLMQKGMVDLDAPVSTYVPDLPNGDTVTTRQIAAHLSGWEDVGGKWYYTLEHFDTDEFLQHLRQMPVAADPGERVMYNTAAYTVIAAVIEHVTRSTFLDVVDEEVVRPLRLRATCANRRDALISDRTAFYVRSEDHGGVLNAPFSDPSYKWAGAGFLMSASDAARFGAALLDDAFLDPWIRQEIFTPQRTNDGRATIYGLGWRISRGDDGTLIYHQPGGGPGITAHVVLLPDHDMSVALLANMTSAPLDESINVVVESFRDAQLAHEKETQGAESTTPARSGAG